MTLLLTFLSIYTIVGLMVAGRFLLSQELANKFLGSFILVICIEQLYFIYETSDLMWTYPQLYMVTFPIALLLGPLLYRHIKLLHGSSSFKFGKFVIEFIPFFIYIGFTNYLFNYEPGPARFQYVFKIFYRFIQPLEFVKLLHLLIYMVLMGAFIFRKRRERSVTLTNYMNVILVFFFVMAFLHTLFVGFTLNSSFMVTYYLIASTLVFFAGYTIYYQPKMFSSIAKKYSQSSLSTNDISRIIEKLEDYLSDQDHLKNNTLNLSSVAVEINERKHHISQALSTSSGMSFSDLLNSKRVELSKQLMLDPANDRLKLYGIAIESGFSNKSTFNRVFLKFNKCTPSEYKSKNR